MLPVSIRRRAAVAVLGCALLADGAAAYERAVVVSEHALASAVGADILRQGGNVVDAAVATSLAVCVLNPSSCGIGGGGFMVIYLAKEKKAVALDYRETAPQKATRDMFVRGGRVDVEASRRGGLAVAVPGEVAGLFEAVRTYGSIPLARLMQPAIRLARDGYPVGKHLASVIEQYRDAIRRSPGLAANFLRPDGTPPAEGETIRQPQLAATLQRIADEGPQAFYSGDIARAIAEAAAAAGGVIGTDDLKTYRPRWRQPIRIGYRGYEIITMPPPSSAGVLLQVLGILRDDDLAALGHGSTAYFHLLAEAMKHAFADRARFYGDAAFADVPLGRLLSATSTSGLRARIRAGTTLAEPGAYGSSPVSASPPPAGAGTSHLSVMDAEGNAVACTTTINTAFGSMVVAGDTGIILNNEMDDFSAHPGTPNAFGLIGSEANAIAPGKRPLSSMSPTIAARGGEAVLAAGGSGGPLILSGTLQVMLNALVFDRGAADAVAAPRIHHQWMPPVLAVEASVPAATRAALSEMGHQVQVVPELGAVQLARRRGRSLEGAADPRKHGGVAGW